ncbi:VrrA/YqfQ family protein [Virgibacillus xinjiangensis]|uniref:VrrA/YqfQ family protein n=1 Tax=Virgibacillus xinjiangensis TaxID=393090 RepID=A0ABV7CR44_9BACI
MFFPPQHPRNHPGSYERSDFMFPAQQPRGANRRGFSDRRIPAERINKGVEGLSKTLGNVEQVLKVVQSAAPIVQEYGPMVKNLPAMYRMMKAIKEIEDSPDQEAETDTKSFSKQDAVYDEPSSKERRKTDRTTDRRNRGESTPRLFI